MALESVAPYAASSVPLSPGPPTCTSVPVGLPATGSGLTRPAGQLERRVRRQAVRCHGRRAATLGCRRSGPSGVSEPPPAGDRDARSSRRAGLPGRSEHHGRACCRDQSFVREPGMWEQWDRLGLPSPSPSRSRDFWISITIRPTGRREGGREGLLTLHRSQYTSTVLATSHLVSGTVPRAASAPVAETVPVPARAERCGDSDHSRGEPRQCVPGQVSVLSELAFLVA